MLNQEWCFGSSIASPQGKQEYFMLMIMCTWKIFTNINTCFRPTMLCVWYRLDMSKVKIFSQGYCPRVRVYFLPELHMDVPAEPRKIDFLYTNFLSNYTPISIPFSIENHPILPRLGAFYNKLLKIHPIFEFGFLCLMKTHR